MGDLVTLNDANWRTTIEDKPALLIFSNGEGLRGDCINAFRKAAPNTKHIIFAEVNPVHNPELKRVFDVGEKALLIGTLKGETLVRKSRPWGSDVTLAVELLGKKYQESQQKPSAGHMSDHHADHDEASSINQPETPIKTNINQHNGEIAMTDMPNNAPVVVTDDTFQELVIDHSKEMPVIVDFWAEWCGPCRMVAPIMESLAKEYEGKVRVAKVDTDANPGLSQAFQIMSIPTNMIFKGGHLVFSQPGAFPEATYRDLLDQVIDLDVEAAIAEAQAKEAGTEVTEE